MKGRSWRLRASPETSSQQTTALESGLDLLGHVLRNPLRPNVRHVLDKPLRAVFTGALVLGHPEHHLADLGLGPAPLLQVVHDRADIRALRKCGAGERDHFRLLPIIWLRIRA